MLEKIYVNKSDNTDLNMYKCGIEDCSPGHSWGPAVRDHYLIHFVLDGKGIFKYADTTYTLEKGQGFLICPNKVAYYQADMENPWTYSWVGFHGLKAEKYLNQSGLNAKNPVFTYNNYEFIKKCFSEMISTKKLSKSGEIKRLGILYLIFSQLIEDAAFYEKKYTSENTKEFYIKRAIEYVQINYYRKVNVADLSKHVRLDRSYLSSIFKQYLSMSPQQFIIEYKINKACELLKDNSLSVGDVSRSVGYEDPLLFSKIFKKVKSSSPRQFRKELT